MSNTSKGAETKTRIINCARILFYEQGYSDTSLRQISEKAGTNIGLINYYFESKAGIAMQIYSDIRSAFNDLLVKYEPDLSSDEFFILSSAIELKLALDCKSFGNFYFTLSQEPLFHERISRIIMNIIERHENTYLNEDLGKLNCMGIMAIKPTLVIRADEPGFDIAHDTVEEYYMKMQLQMLGMDRDESDRLMGLLRKYYLNLVSGFTPVMTPLIG